MPQVHDIAAAHIIERRDHVLLQLTGSALFLKALFWIFFFIWVRWSIPRFRYDQLMYLGWRMMFPLALANAVITAIVVAALR